MLASLTRQPKLFIGTAALLLAGAAHAEMTLYGLVDLSYGKNEIVDGKGSKADFHSGGDSGSSQGNSTTKIGLKGTTEVASGLKANFQFETGGITSKGEVNPGGAFFNRQAWAGLSGGFGEVRLGKQDSVAFQTQAGFDFNGAANAASAFFNSGVSAALPGRQDRSLQYIAPVMGGLKIQVGAQPAGNVAGAKSTGSIGATYTLDKFSVGVAAESKRFSTTKSFASVATSYDLGLAKVMASYADGGAPASGGTGKGFGVGAVAPVAGYNIGVNYGENSDTKVKAAELFINREVFKNTSVYLDVGRVTGKLNIYALGAIYAF